MYFIEHGNLDEVMHRIDTDFVPELSQEPGFVAYQCVDTGENTLCTITTFRDEFGADRSNELAARFVRDKLADMKVVRTDIRRGDVLVSRVESEMLEEAHA
jgi:hypothetical protein